MRCRSGEHSTLFISGRDNGIRSKQLGYNASVQTFPDRFPPGPVGVKGFAVGANGRGQHAVAGGKHWRKGSGNAEAGDPLYAGPDRIIQLAAQVAGVSAADNDAHALTRGNAGFTLQTDNGENHSPYATRREFVCFRLR